MIEINNLTARLIEEEFLKRVARIVLKKEKREIELSIVLVGQSEIKRINKKYRQENKATDILSFLYSDNSGEIVICVEEVERNAKEFKSDFKRELIKILVNGVLHLLGYTHEKVEQEIVMREKEKHYLLKLPKEAQSPR